MKKTDEREETEEEWGRLGGPNLRIELFRSPGGRSEARSPPPGLRQETRNEPKPPGKGRAQTQRPPKP